MICVHADRSVCADDNGQNISVSNTVSNTHTYMIDWQPDSLSWYIDGKLQRTKSRNETYNSTTQQYHYPQSPSRVQLSLWPAGLSSNGEGTIEWAGGLVDWNSQYMQNGYYYAMVSDVSVKCYDPPDGWNNNFGNKAYYYENTYGTNDTVAIGNNNTQLASFYATGNDPKKDPNAAASSAAAGSSKTASSATQSATPETVPGVSGGGAAGIGGTDSSGSAQGGSDSGSGTNSAANSQASSQGGGSTQFSQGDGNDGSSGGSGGTSQAPPRLAAGSAVALLGFFIACVLL